VASTILSDNGVTSGSAGLKTSADSTGVLALQTTTAGGTASTTQVDAQPIKGPVFEFSTIPKTKQAGVGPLNLVNDSGVMLFRKGQLSGSDNTAWAEPPVRKAFHNVVKSAYVRLPPGQLKDMNVTKEWEGYFEKVLLKWRITEETTASVLNNCPGKSQIVFLEEELNSGSENPIVVAYETQHTIGCQFTTGSSPNMQPTYTAAVYNNF